MKPQQFLHQRALIISNMVISYNAFMLLRCPTGGRAAPILCVRRQRTNSCSQNIDRRSFAHKALLAVAAVILGPAGISAGPERKDEGFPSRTQKKMFAEALEHCQRAYETNIASRKEQLFSRMKATDVVADIGMGTGPNLKYMPRGVRVFGVEPNQYMWPYASEKAETYDIDLSLLEGVAEDLPLEDSSCDFVITTLTLCSVSDPERAVQEILRVLKPGGQHLFIEHVVASQSRPILRGAQNLLNPLQVAIADGCHLNRETGCYLKKASSPGFSEVRFEEFDASLNSFVDWINPVRPHICGFARKASL